MAKKPTASDLLASVPTAKASLAFTGVVRAVDNDETVIAFSRGVTCSGWTNIPVDLVDGLDFVQSIQCQEGTYPLVRLRLKQPTTEEGKVLAALAGPDSPVPTGDAATRQSFAGIDGTSMCSPMFSLREDHFAGGAFGPRRSLICGWVWDVQRQTYVYRCL